MTYLSYNGPTVCYFLSMMPGVRSIGAVLALVLVGVTYGQNFEVASVKPSPPPGPGNSSRLVRGGPGSTDPGSATLTNMDLFSLVTMAYDVQSYQLSGPDWMHGARFDIAAKVPPGATREQYRLMLQHLLAERFQLVVHRDRKEMPTYEMVVGKGGSKMKESADDSAAADDGSLQPSPVAPSPPPGYNGPLTMLLRKSTLEQLAARVSAQLGQAVTDATGLRGKYDITLQYTLAGLQAGATSEAPPGPTIFDALEQLGLKLVSKKGPADILVIDHVERAPSEN